MSLFFVRRLMLVFAAVCTSLASATESPSGSAEPKSHTLFMGVDLSLEQNKEIYRVHGVEGGAFLIDVKGKEVRVPIDRGNVKLMITPSMKLTEKSAAVTNLKGERAYTINNDPIARFEKGLAAASQMTAGNEAAINQAQAAKDFSAATVVNAAVAGNPVGGAPGSAPAAAPAQQNSPFSLQHSQHLTNVPGAGFNSSGGSANYEGQYDAMDVVFSVSSERPLNNPYVVVVVQFRVTDGKPGQVGNWIYARSLDAINRDTRRIHIEEGGFPFGFELVDFQVHLYNRGEEIATTVAPKRVELTRDEAFQYVMIEYVSSHKGATLPATPAMGKLPADLAERLANGQLKAVYYVKVAKDGKVTETFADESCSEKVDDPYLNTVVKKIRFNPALEKGKPVDGVAMLKLNKLSI